ncbi:transporter [Ganoderma sinense ZZ0214-1]|uniref:Transporter n=1 Tax=Ganoderma sinense ZZ0214-1 TaxID=1077348 RepID=A0A2G8S0N1_9APHY|nr:transporter [Ganoderma sinense ZZ0214-1]
MKVLLRREPSITAIIDQFSHVCLYHHNGQKWEKHGYEGSMFLFEKSTTPTYGFYILNRMGTDDYVRPIYPEDDMEIIGDYLMCRFYPDFTKTRLEMGLPYPIPQERRAAFDMEVINRLPPEEREKDQSKEKKGRSTTLGLWMFATDAREPLKEVMMRLHSYIKQGLPYPDEYRYGPGRPPPPNPHLRTVSRASSQATLGDLGSRAPSTAPVNGVSASPAPGIGSAAATTQAGSEIDKLFAKLLTPSPSTNAPLANGVADSQPQKSIHDLFAGLSGGGNNSVTQHMLPSAPASAPVFEPPPQTGIPLLNSIFASALPSGPSSALVAPPPQPLPSQPEDIVIVSPKPTSSALPQILNQDVISSLLGLNSRASSAAPSSVGSRRSGQQRYEGDNELSEGDQTSDGEPRRYNMYSGAGSTNGVPTVTVPQTPDSDSEGEDARAASGPRRVPGDVTPRPPVGGIRLPPTSPPQFQHSGAPNPTVNGKVYTNGAASPSPAPAGAPRQRALVPFEANSDLWPYPRAPLDDRSYENDEVVELDFSDTRALSDPAIFISRLKEKKEKKGKKSRKEREKDKEREQAEIEKGWDLPTQAQVQPPYQAAATGPVAEAARPKAAKAAKGAAVNGSVVNGVAAGRPAQNGAVNGVAAKEAILGALLTKAPAQASIGRNDFVRELLGLIHTDSQFVDRLYQDYLSRSA